jgi:hypothetical protein
MIIDTMPSRSMMPCGEVQQSTQPSSCDRPGRLRIAETTVLLLSIAAACTRRPLRRNHLQPGLAPAQRSPGKCDPQKREPFLLPRGESSVWRL